MIPKYSVKRPYTVLVAVVLVIVLGVVSLMRMTTDLLPPMNLPYVIVVTTDVGASPEEVEKDVTSPIEAAMATTSNINNVSSCPMITILWLFWSMNRARTWILL